MPKDCLQNLPRKVLKRQFFVYFYAYLVNKVFIRKVLKRT